MTSAEKWYRYEGIRSCYTNEYDEVFMTRPAVKLVEMEVVSHTPKGVWLKLYPVLKSARKRFACPTIEEAKESFIARKRKQISIHQAVIDRATEEIKLLNQR